MKIIGKIKEKITNLIVNAGLSTIKRRSPILKEVLENPEGLKVEAYMEKDEIIVHIKKKGS